MSKRKEFISKIISKTELTKKEAEEVMEAVFESAEETLLETGEVVLGNMGKLKSVERAERTARNPKTGEEIKVPAKTAAKYCPSKYMKEKLNS